MNEDLSEAPPHFSLTTPLLSKMVSHLSFYLWVAMVIFSFTLSAGLVTGSHQTAWAEPRSRPGNELASITTPNGSIILAEIADSPDTRAKGLMDRPLMAQDGGMLFQFPDLGYWTFWMKNTKIPLDIVWLDKKGTIIHIESNVPICTRTDDHCPRYYSHKKSWQVLELNAGMAGKLELTPGSKLMISVPDNRIPY